MPPKRKLFTAADLGLTVKRPHVGEPEGRMVIREGQVDPDRRQRKPRKKKRQEPRYREISGGGFETNRRKH